ncbi:MAG TPA: S8 family serine peptidase [Polyangiaceae bacterium]|nr:S8 family serine peptidase [Polyangiaceae bacterium]
MRRTSFLVALAVGLALAAPASASPPKPRALSPSLALLDRVDGLRRFAHPALSGANATVPVVVEIDHDVASADTSRLEALGARFPRDGKGRVLGSSRTVTAEVPRGALEAVARAPGVVRVDFDGQLFPSPAPLDLTTHLVSADAVWRSRDANGLPITGKGVTICDVDVGTDVFHPSFFRADGGYFDWIDDDHSGRFEPDHDSIDLGDGPVKVRALNGVVAQYWDGSPVGGTEDPAYDPRYDYLYADENGDGRRNFGRAEGFDDASPSFGERFLVPDDVNGNGVLDVGEKMVALASSKIVTLRHGTDVYRRGENLVDVPAFQGDMLHGVGSSGVMVAGQPGLSHLVGMAPDADLIMATDDQGDRQVQMTQFCIQEGARVVLHEYAPWVGYHLDGSSQLEKLIDSSFENKGVVHINPAGNLSTAKKLMKRSILAGETRDITLKVPPIGAGNASYMIASFLWRDTTRELAMTLTSPSGASVTLDTTNPFGFQKALDDKLDVAGVVDDSTRGTRMFYFYVFPHSGTVGPLDLGDWKLGVTDTATPGEAPITLIGYVEDELSGWGQGVQFVDDVSEDHLIGWPGTADHGIAIAAFTGHDEPPDVSGQRAFYSGRGRRIDDAQILWISGPDNPIVPAHFDDFDLAYMPYGGTSGASPHVAGAAALMLSADPTLSAEDVRNRLKDGAVSDADTGAVPNEDFGNGKLDVYRSLFGAPAPEGSPPIVEDQSFDVPAGESVIDVVATDPDGDALVLEIDREYDGTYDETASAASFDLGIDEPGDYVMKVRATDPTGRTDAALLRVHVGPERDVTIQAAGGGCSTTPGETGRGAVALSALAAAFALGARRRRRR